MNKQKDSAYYMTKGQKNVAQNMPYCDTPCQKAKETSIAKKDQKSRP